MPARRSPLAFAVSLLVLAACTRGSVDAARPSMTGPAAPPPSAGAGAAAEGRIENAVCAVSELLLQRTWRGDRRDLSGDIQLLPKEPNFVGHGGLPHS